MHPAEEPGRDAHEFALALLARYQKLRFPAGSKAVYSNVGYIALGEVISAAAGQRYEDYVRSQILKPLSMTQTGFRYEDVHTGEVAAGHQARLSPMTSLFRLMLPKGVVGGNRGRFLTSTASTWTVLPTGGLVGSARDAARFMAAHLNVGTVDAVRVLAPESVVAMQAITARGPKLDVGLG